VTSLRGKYVVICKLVENTVVFIRRTVACVEIASSSSECRQLSCSRGSVTIYSIHSACRIGARWQVLVMCVEAWLGRAYPSTMGVGTRSFLTIFLETGQGGSGLVDIAAWVFLAHLLEACVHIWAVVVAAECTLECTAVSFRKIGIASILRVPKPEVIWLSSRSLSFSSDHMSPSLIRLNVRIRCSGIR